MPVPPCCITLVHGTWARRAAWVKDDSLFCRQLRQVLGPTLQFCAFTWSGANWQSKRLRAAAELSQQLAAGVLLMPVSLLLMPFGPEAILIAPLMELSVEVSPPGSSTLGQFNPSNRSVGLFHSAAYADKQVIDAIGQWINEIIRRDPPK